MTKKVAIITIEFDDEHDDFQDASDLATFAEIRLGRDNGLKNLDLTVYARPDDLMLDTAEGYTIFSPGRPDAGSPISPPAVSASSNKI